LARRGEWDEWKEAKEEIKRLFQDLPLLKNELKQFQSERQAILESLSSSGVNPRVQTSDVKDPTFAKTAKLQKLEKKYLETLLLVKRMEDVEKILFSGEEKQLFRLHFIKGKTSKEISQWTGRAAAKITKDLNRLTERIWFWLK